MDKFITTTACAAMIVTGCGPSYTPPTPQQQEAQSEIEQIGAALAMYLADTTKPADDSLSLDVLLKSAGGKGPYLSDAEVLNDPWGNRYVLRVQEGSADVFSTGPDGVEGGGDDVH